MDQTIRAEVPIELTGEAPAVKTLGGILVTGVSTIEVEALPGDLPDRITVNLSSLEKIDDSISVRQLPVGEGVKVLTNPDEVVAHVVFQAAEVVEEVKEVVPAEAEPEVISRGKKEEEEGAEPTPAE
jgi:large subunit ribosomal protein L25